MRKLFILSAMLIFSQFCYALPLIHNNNASMVYGGKDISKQEIAASKAENPFNSADSMVG